MRQFLLRVIFFFLVLIGIIKSGLYLINNYGYYLPSAYEKELKIVFLQMDYYIQMFENKIIKNK